jgi:membrane carboxypeptidase/penicillin-binding protein PbpC
LIGFGTNSILKVDRTAAVKTGTTTNFHDNWTIGYTPDLVVGVWVGNSDRQAMHEVSGVTGAAPIWHELIRSILQGQPDKPFARPDGLTQVEVCDLSGLLPTEICPHVKTEWFISGTQPTTPDTFYKRTNSGEIVLDLPLAAQAWARRQGFRLWMEQTEATSELLLVSPADATTYRITPNLDLSAQQILLSALVNARIQNITFYADGVALGTASALPYEMWWQLSPGEHRFWVEGMTVDGEVIKSNVVTIIVE